jgi:hypothetical protein
LLGSVRYLRNILRDVVGADRGPLLREISLVAWVAVDNCCIVPLVAFRSGAERAIEHTTFDRQFALIKPC